MSSLFQQLSDSMADTVAEVSPSLVRVEARRRLPASGIAWSADTIVTSNHGVEQEDNIVIGLHDGARVPAQLIGRDPANDLAVLRVPGGAMTPARWGDNTTLRVGQLVLAVGRPADAVQATLGVISALVAGVRRSEDAPRKRTRRQMGQILADGFIQTDVVMYPGFSGGALLTGDGLIHGLNTSGFQTGASVTVPVTTLRNTVNTLMTHGRMKQGYLGVGVQPVRLPASASREQEAGLLVISVEADSPAERVGVMVGDILTALDGQATETVDELLLMLQGERVGRTVDLDLLRGGQAQRLAITIGERSQK